MFPNGEKRKENSREPLFNNCNNNCNKYNDKCFDAGSLSLSLLGAVAPCDDDDDGSARRAMMTALADAADG